MPGQKVVFTEKQREFSQKFWAYPYEPWVIETWRRHSESVDGPAIAAQWRKNLLDPRGAEKAAGVKRKPHAPLKPPSSLS